MASFDDIFDASSVEPAAPLDPLPPGKYVAHIVQSEMQPTKAGDGQLLSLELEILEGPHSGRKVRDRLNLKNASQKAVEIAERQLSAICHAVGQLKVTDSEQLHFRRLVVILAVEPDSRDKHLPVEQQRKQNRVKAYGPAEATTQRSAAGAPSQPAAPSRSAPPWRREV